MGYSGEGRIAEGRRDESWANEGRGGEVWKGKEGAAERAGEMRGSPSFPLRVS